MADSKLPDPKALRSGYVVIKNTQTGGVRGLRNWKRLVDADGPKKFQRGGKDPGVD